MSYLCFDVGGTFVKYGLFDDDAKFLMKSKYPTHADNPELFFADMAAIANAEAEVEAVGISFPGFVDPDTGIAARAGALGAMDGMNLIAEFKAHLQRELPVVIDNDAKCAALAEMLNGGAVGVKDFAVLTLGTGVGCGIVLNGQVLHGHHFRAGEFGMSITDFSKNGFATLHDLAATSALVKAYANSKHVPVRDVSGEKLMADLASSDTVAVLEQWAQYVAVAVFNLVATIDPELVLIGGGISKNPEVLRYIQSALAKNPFWTDYRTTVALCQHDNDAGLIGALALIQQRQ